MDKYYYEILQLIKDLACIIDSKEDAYIQYKLLEETYRKADDIQKKIMLEQHNA